MCIRLWKYTDIAWTWLAMTLLLIVTAGLKALNNGWGQYGLEKRKSDFLCLKSSKLACLQLPQHWKNICEQSSMKFHYCFQCGCWIELDNMSRSLLHRDFTCKLVWNRHVTQSGIQMACSTSAHRLWLHDESACAYKYTIMLVYITCIK